MTPEEALQLTGADFIQKLIQEHVKQTVDKMTPHWPMQHEYWRLPEQMAPPMEILKYPWEYLQTNTKENENKVFTSYIKRNTIDSSNENVEDSIMKALSVVVLALVLTGCGVAKNTSTPTGELKIGSNGVKYVLTCMEGHKFIATQGTHDYWSFAGPVGTCGNN